MAPAKTKPTTLAGALAAAQANMSNATKNATNPHFKNRYADLAAVRDVVMPALNAQGIACTQHVEGADGNVTVRTMLHWGESSLEVGNCTIKIDGRNAAQAVGSATSYLRRYQLASVGGVAQVDDDAQAVSTPAPQTSRAPQGRPAAMTAGGNPEDCPKCGGPMWDNVAKRAGGWKGPAYKCKNGECDGLHWDAPGHSQAEAIDREERDERGGVFNDDLPF